LHLVCGNQLDGQITKSLSSPSVVLRLFVLELNAAAFTP
jgi:hypothetical protein